MRNPSEMNKNTNALTGTTGGSVNVITNTGANTFTGGTGAAALVETGTLFYVLYEDAGQNGEEIGCGDSIIDVDIALPRNVQSAEDQLVWLYEQLLAGTSLPIGAANALNTGLVLSGVTLNGNAVRVDLTGTLTVAGVCDTPRVQEQLTRTALEFPGVDMAAIYMDGEILSSYLSLKE